MEEVDERFPPVKYKTWRAHREAMGLCSAGGIKTEPNSRAGSIRNVEVVAPAAVTDEKDAAAAAGINPAVSSTSKGPATEEQESSAVVGRAEDSQSVKDSKRLSDSSDLKAKEKDVDHEDDDDEPEDVPVPPELMKSVGDSCAICLDAIEDDDDVRGLTCGHAFHTVCLDPWLTSRRACCPLCKKDYFIPKPRPEGESATPAEGTSNQRSDRGPGAGGASWLGPSFHRRLFPFGRQPGNNLQQTHSNSTQAPALTRTYSRFPHLTFPRPAFLRRNGRGTATSPRDLEAGTARA